MSASPELFDRNPRTRRLGRLFETLPACRPAAVQALADGALVADASSQEQAAAITLLCAVLPFDEVVQRLERRPLQGSSGELAVDFFPVLEANAAALERAGLDQSAADLMRIGELLAETHQQQDLAERYRRQRMGKTVNRLRGMPFRKQRGR